MSTNKIAQFPTPNADVLLAHDAARDFEAKLILLVEEAIDKGAYSSTLVGVLNTTAFQVMLITADAEDAGT